MKNRIKLILAGSMLITLFAACNKDKEYPVVVVNSPLDNGTYKWNSTLDLEMIFTDNEALKSYRVYLADEHGVTQPEFLFDYKSSLIDGNSFTFHEHETVPPAIQDFYYLYVQVCDEAGNETIKQMRLNFEQ